MSQSNRSLETVATMPGREFGLAMKLVFGGFMLDMKDLHYGYWPDGLAVEPANFTKAQAAYTEFLIAAIPAGTKAILDVGCGAGNNALRLLEHGYRVSCVSPNGHLNEVAKRQLGNRVPFFECGIEDLATERRYDLVLFSESLLFMPMTTALDKALALLNPGGYILITDLFKLPAESKSPIGGGQRLSGFRETLARMPLEVVQDIDITERIAPTFDLLDRAYREMIRPAYDLILTRLRLRHPWAMMLVRWKFRRSFEKYEGKHFSGRRDGAHFIKYKSYRLFLLRKRSGSG
ncbi:MAG: class I SAM-dependent methyltransferase [Gammaproteobacteria bacterium]